MRLALRPVSLVLSLLLISCAGDELGERSDEVSVRPTEGSSKLTVNVAHGWAAADILVQREDGAADGIKVVPGGVTDLSPGKYCIRTVIGGFATQRACNLVIAEGTHVTYAL